MSTEPVETEIVTLATAFREVAATMKAVHKVFIRLAIWIPIILVLFMVILTVVIVQVGWNTEARLNGKFATMPADIAKALHVEQTQNVNVERPKTREEEIADIVRQRDKSKGQDK